MVLHTLCWPAITCEVTGGSVYSPSTLWSQSKAWVGLELRSSELVIAELLLQYCAGILCDSGFGFVVLLGQSYVAQAGSFYRKMTLNLGSSCLCVWSAWITDSAPSSLIPCGTQVDSRALHMLDKPSSNWTASPAPLTLFISVGEKKTFEEFS